VASLQTDGSRQSTKAVLRPQEQLPTP